MGYLSFKIATMCSGIGSPEQSIKELEVEHENVFACEKDKFARQTYLANFTPGFMLEDMTKCDWIGEQYYADLVVAGIPCQSFSLAGKRLGEKDHRGLLFYDFYRYVKNKLPRVFIIENVKGLLSDNSGKTFGNWLQLLGQSVNGRINMFNHPDSLMYNLHWRVLNAKDYSLPQNRERIFLIGIRNDLPSVYHWPKKEKLKLRLIDLLESDVDEKYYLSDEMLQKISQSGTFINQDTQASQIHNIFSVSPSVCSGTHGYAMGYVPELSKSVHTSGRMSTDRHSWDLIKVAQLPGFESNGRVYSEQGLAPNIRAKQSGLVQVSTEKRTENAKQIRKQTGSNDFRDKELIFKDSDIANCLPTGKSNDQFIRIKEATKQGFALAQNGDSVNLKHPNSTTRRGRVGK